MAVPAATRYNVGGVLLAQPFKIRRLGHFGLNVVNLEAMPHFYLDLLGFRQSDAFGSGGFFARYGTDHHALVIIDKQAADKMLLASPTGERHFRPENTINQITWQVQSRREVVDATQYFRDYGVDINREGRAGGPGSNYHLYVYRSRRPDRRAVLWGRADRLERPQQVTRCTPRDGGRRPRAAPSRVPRG